MLCEILDSYLTRIGERRKGLSRPQAETSAGNRKRDFRFLLSSLPAELFGEPAVVFFTRHFRRLPGVFQRFPGVASLQGGEGKAEVSLGLARIDFESPQVGASRRLCCCWPMQS